jgi:hypothetical protein
VVDSPPPLILSNINWLLGLVETGASKVVQQDREIALYHIKNDLSGTSPSLFGTVSSIWNN